MKLTQMEFAAKFYISLSTLHYLETGDGEPKTTIPIICVA
jgi:DNA-binding transcriptional regulator YiaG